MRDHTHGVPQFAGKLAPRPDHRTVFESRLRRYAPRFGGRGRACVDRSIVENAGQVPHPRRKDDPGIIGDAHAHMHGFDAGIGTKLRVNPFEFGVGWRYRKMYVDDSDVVGGFFYNAIDTQFSGLVLTMAVRF